MRHHQKFKTNKKDWTAFSESVVEKIEEIIQAACQYNESQVLLTLQPNFEDVKGCVVLMVLLWILPGLKSFTSILDHLKEDVMKIEQQNTMGTVPNFKKDQEHIAGLEVTLNALVNMSHRYSPFIIISYI